MCRAPLVILMWCLTGIVSGAAPGSEVLVSAASSLSDVLEQLAPLYQSRSGERLAVNLGPSNTLARQILAGARVDVFISADAAQMNTVGAELMPGTRVDLLSNQLAIAVPSDRAGEWKSARDLASPSIRRIAIGDPSAVPAGVYAKEYLQKQGLWPALQPKLIPSGSVRLALAAVENGAVDAAIVYRTDLVSARRVRTALIVAASDGPEIVYPAAALRDAPNAAGARRLLQFLQSAEAAAIFERAGFVPLRRTAKATTE